MIKQLTLALLLLGGILLLVLLPAACSPPPLPKMMAADGGARELVVFDIDGTLTPDVFSTRLPREHAAETVDLFAKNGLHVVYLSARFPWFSSRLPDWLSQHEFAEGPVFAAQSIGDNRKPSRFKLTILEELKRDGWRFAAAYGDSSTDFLAYSDAGIPKERVFALKREGEEQCAPGPWAECLEGWDEHVFLVAGQLTNISIEAD